MSSLVKAAGAGRYAPTPSGDLHVGNLRTAILAHLAARATDRSFFMRIEDIDRDRDKGAWESQKQDLTAIGVDWDRFPLLQSMHHVPHQQALTYLRDAGLTYECTCTRRDILSAPSAPHGPPGVYPGTCRGRSLKEQEAARREIYPRLPAIRLRNPREFCQISFDDAVLGRVTAIVDDFVLARGDGTFSYNLASVVDDEYWKINQVVRGDDLALSTPRQILLQRLLGFSTPEYAHVPLVINTAGARLAKRDGAVTLGDLKAIGYSVEQVRAMLLKSVGLPDAPTEELINIFDIARLPREPWVWEL